MRNQRVYRPLHSDADYTERVRELVKESRDVLKRPNPDTFLGRKTQEPFPAEDTDDARPARAVVKGRKY